MFLIRSIQRRSCGEEGSVIMAMLVVMISTLALVALLITVTGGLTSARNDQNRTNAFQYANAGIDQALYRLDQGQLPLVAKSGYTPNVVGSAVVGFTETLVVNGSLFNVVAEQNPAGQSRVWKIRSTGTDPSGRVRQAITTVESTPLFRNGFFTLKDFSITGTQTSPIAYRSSGCPNPPDDAPAGTDCNLGIPVPGTLGTNGTFGDDQMSDATAESFKKSWDGFNMYGKTSQAAADAACADGRCAPKAVAITDPLTVIVPPAPVGAKPCPSLSSPILPDDYTCSKLEFPSSAVTVSGSSGDVRIWVDGPITAQNGTVVNEAQQTRRFQIFQSLNPADSNGAWPGSICDSEFWALLYTPGLTMDCTGEHEPTIYGAVVAQLHTGTGNHFDFHWDISSLNLVHDGKYVIRDWRECPASKTDC